MPWSQYNHSIKACFLNISAVYTWIIPSKHNTFGNYSMCLSPAVNKEAQSHYCVTFLIKCLTHWQHAFLSSWPLRRPPCAGRCSVRILKAGLGLTGSPCLRSWRWGQGFQQLLTHIPRNNANSVNEQAECRLDRMNPFWLPACCGLYESKHIFLRPALHSMGN